MNVIVVPVFQLLFALIDIYTLILFITIILHWLVAFGVVNTQSRFVAQVVHVLDQLTEPVLRRVRRVIPAIGGIDLSPIVVFLGLQFLKSLLMQLLINLGY